MNESVRSLNIINVLNLSSFVTFFATSRNILFYRKNALIMSLLLLLFSLPSAC